ncbi:hypothetical protein NX862_11040 [Rhodobacter sp. KR11]|uniref:hypothetical protein n=1 Tax=Rhodobacter sp. KR11 TaxID=2974588 RepID=UPI00222397D8|nr:hypothetical protein [Rhodobacter sp. KR11]MCW1919293.1 hypothetical protein [Rhodobacter sp. KR11]
MRAPGSQGAGSSRASTIAGQRPAPLSRNPTAARAQAIARALPAPSLWLADVLILGLALTLLRLFA